MKKLILSSLVVVFWWGGVSYAQSPWLSNSQSNKILLEWAKPIFSDEMGSAWEKMTAGSSVYFLTGEIGVTEKISLTTELPFSYLGFVEEYISPEFDYENTIIGNIYIGGILRNYARETDDQLFIEFGVRLPTTPEPRIDKVTAQSTGLRSELSDRFEAFVSNTWSVPLIANLVKTLQEPVAIKFRLGTVWDEREGADNMLFLLYGLTGLYHTPTIEAYVGINGRSPYVGNNPDFFNDGYSQLQVGLARPFNYIVPGAYLRKPVGENYNQWMDWGYGFNIEFRW